MDTHFAHHQGTHKVSKGENYLDQPYVVLDMPQLKAGELSGKLRLMCWWGHYMSLQYFFTPTPKSVELLQQLPLPHAVVFTGVDVFNNDLAHADFTPLAQLETKHLEGLTQSKVCVKVGFEEFEKLEQEITSFLNAIEGLSK